MQEGKEDVDESCCGHSNLPRQPHSLHGKLIYSFGELQLLLIKKTCIAYFDNGYRSIKIQLAFCTYCDFFNLWILFKIKQSKELDVTLNNLKFLPYITIRKVLFDWFSTHVLYLFSGMNVLQLCHATTSQRGLHLNFFCSVYPTGSSGPKEVSFHSL